jgi:hypothetical protein
MLSRVAACWLVVLVLAPFTAPFPTCDLATVFHAVHTRQAPAKLPVRSRLAGDSEVARVPAMSGRGRVRLSMASGALAFAGAAVAAATPLTRAVERVHRKREHTGLTAILRV